MGSESRRNQRGVALVAIALFLGMLFGIAALAVDVSRLAHVANEVQTVADAAARSGAKALVDAGGTPGVGITRGHLVGGLNEMNGADAPAADVLVDEGNWDFANDEFDCCTSNTPCCATGSWNDITCGSAASCTRRSAVLATPRTTVINLLAGIFDFFDDGQVMASPNGQASSATSRVEKAAIAAASGPAAGCQQPAGCTAGDWACYCNHGVAPCLPIAAPSCEFPAGCTGTGCQLPNLQVSSNGSDTAGWTGFDIGHNDTLIRSFLAQGPCDPPGQNRIIPTESTSSPNIELNNGINSAAANNVFGLTQCLYNNNQGCAVDGNGNIIPGQRGRIFTMPIFESPSATCTGNFNQSAPIVGFATIQITGVSLGSPRTVSITTISNRTGTNQQPGGGCFGTDCRVAMVK